MSKKIPQVAVVRIENAIVDRDEHMLRDVPLSLALDGVTIVQPHVQADTPLARGQGYIVLRVEPAYARYSMAFVDAINRALPTTKTGRAVKADECREPFGPTKASVLEKLNLIRSTLRDGYVVESRGHGQSLQSEYSMAANDIDYLLRLLGA